MPQSETQVQIRQKAIPLAFLRGVLVRNSPHCPPYLIVADGEIRHL